MNRSRQIQATFVAAVAALLILLPATGAEAATVTVAKGNTLSGIVWNRCHTSDWRSVWRDNPQIANPNLIYPGQHLVVNCPGTRTPSSTPSQTNSTPPSSGWVNPIRAGFYVAGRGGCWGAARVGHSHKGVDLTVGSGTPIRAAHAGKVVTIAYQAGGAGHYVVLNNGGGIWTVYMHMRSRTFLNVGNNVSAGQTIGYVGATGDASGPHLHFEVHQKAMWKQINPAPFMRAHGASVGC